MVISYHSLGLIGYSIFSTDTHPIVFIAVSSYIREVPMGQGTSTFAIVISKLLLEYMVDIHWVSCLASQFNRWLMEQVRGRDPARLRTCLSASSAPEHSTIIPLDCVAEATLIRASRTVYLASVDCQLGWNRLLSVAFLMLLLANGLTLAGCVVSSGRRMTACRFLTSS